MAGPTRLELATSGVTGRRSNQLNYDPVILHCTRTLTVRLRLACRPKLADDAGKLRLVGDTGFEPVTAGV